MTLFRHTAILFLLFLLSCTDRPELGIAPLPDTYHQELEEWKSYRIGVLTAPTGWLRLMDLIWLEEGVNRFGTSPDSDIRFPEGSLPDYAGDFFQQEGVISIRVEPGVPITHDGELVREMVIRNEEIREELQYENWIWFIDRRGDRYGVRLFDSTREKANGFQGFPFYETNPDWHLQGELVPWEEERVVPLENVLGDQVEQVSPGVVRFQVDGELLELEVYSASGGRLFVMLADRTSGSETFQAGRYMILDPPDENNRVIIDFNRAFNPPCAFNRFTTCHLPPARNRLDIAIEAGEMRPVGWDGLFD